MIPYMYDEMNLGQAYENPSAVVVANTRMTAYFNRYLLQRAMSVFKWTMPEAWSKRYFLYTLYTKGVVAIMQTSKYGVIPQECGLTGYNVFYQPYAVTVANPLFKVEKPLVIGKDCEIFTMTNDYRGILDIVNYYANLMALVSESASVNILNSRLAYMFAVKDKNQAQSFKKAADQVLSGSPYVVVDKNLIDPISGQNNILQFEQNLSSNFIAPEQFELLRTLENQFATEIGIPNANTNKKERLLTDEVNANNVETYGRADMWLENWKETCEKVEKMFGIDIGVEWRYDPEGGVEDDDGDSKPDRSLEY